MYGFDDEELAAIIKDKLSDPSIYVQLTFDKSQAGGVHERAILAQQDYPNSSLAVGTSERGAIMHLKSFVVDSYIVGGGSTNWSNGGETLQDNELRVFVDPVDAAVVTTRLTAIHTNILQKQGLPPQPAPPQTGE